MEGKELNFPDTESLLANAYAVIMGIGEYKDPRIPSLAYARADAQAVFDLLVNPKKIGINRGNIRLLIDEEATLFNIKSTISGWLFRNADADSTVVVFFAGHGGLEGDRLDLEKDGLAKYLLPWDAEPDNLFASALSNNDFDRLLATIKSNRLAIFMDSCYSGGVIDSRARDIQITDDPYQKLATGSGRVVIAAAQPNQRSFEDDSLKHGIFAYHLLEALKGKADYDSDGYMTVTEVFKYLEKEVPKAARQLADSLQEPVLHGDLTRDIVLAVDLERLEQIRRKKELEERAAVERTRKEKLLEWYTDGKLTANQYNKALTIVRSDSAGLNEEDKRIARLTESLLAGMIDIENYAETLKMMGIVEEGIDKLTKEVQNLRSEANKHIVKEEYAAAKPILERILELVPDDDQAMRLLERVSSALQTQEEPVIKKPKVRKVKERTTLWERFNVSKSKLLRAAIVVGALAVIVPIAVWLVGRGSGAGVSQEEVLLEGLFRDDEMVEAIRGVIGRPEGPIDALDLKGLTTFSATEYNITDLTGLEHATNLTFLNLRDGGISDISPLSSLTKLTYLHLSSNQISDISALSDLTNVSTLTLAGNQISDISPLSSLTSLSTLDLSGNEISDISSLSSLTSLSILDLAENQISDILPLLENTGLSIGSTVDLSNNPLTGLSEYVYIPQLEQKGVRVYY